MMATRGGRGNGTCRLGCLLALLVMIGAALAAPAAAQTPTPNEINEIAKDLWCPLCNGVRLDNCELQACVQMREVISQRLEAGASKDDIQAYFVQQYGDVVLGAPAAKGFGLIVRALPWLIAVVGIGWLVFLVRSFVRRRPAGGAMPGRPTQAEGGDQDKYMKEVEEELRRGA